MYDPHRKRIRQKFRRKVLQWSFDRGWARNDPQHFEDWISRNFDNRHPCSCDCCCNVRRGFKGRRKAKLTKREWFSLLDLLEFDS